MKMLRFFQKRPLQADYLPSDAMQRDANSLAADAPEDLRHLVNRMSREDMICACRRMAEKELALAQSAQTKGCRTDHVFNAASWSERADLLQRIENSFQKREALDRVHLASIDP